MKCMTCTNLCDLWDEDENKIVGLWCDKIHDSPDENRERKCKHYKGMTNGDKLRSLSNSELAVFMWYILDELSGQLTTAKQLEEFLGKEYRG